MPNELARGGLALAAAALLLSLGLHDEANAQAWQRSRMEQGYYAAFITGAAGAKLRLNCTPAPDSDKMSIDSLTYTPAGKIAAKRELAATIGIDGNAKNFTMAAKSDIEGDPVEIWLTSDDLDSLEALKDLVAAMRKGRSLTIAVPALRDRDTFPLANVGAALGRCQ